MGTKIGFVTCVQLGLSCIEKIYSMEGQLDIVITLKDEKAQKKSGRIFLDKFAEDHNIPLLKINNINQDIVEKTIKEKELDWLFIIGWSQIAKKNILNAPRRGCIGMHPTLLPQGRGRASIPWAILKGLKETGVTLFRLDEGTDTGDIIGQEVISLSAKITATELYNKVNEAHITLLEQFWNGIVEDKISLKKQNEREATYWEGRRPEDGEIYKDMALEEALTLIRAVTKPYPGAFYTMEDEKWIIWSARGSDTNGLPVSDGFIEPIEYEIVKQR
ncbi:formyltransferase family protein [[Clostridium] symbiosum]|uniref:formyltransferase family protein n=2 Tax=Clostridium symbiosum TaxID=1512 RepID=UPI001570D8FA|nr:formyltransferase family protein [[Clostridium] symbiosum]MCB6350459.1 methionyl-tRNA formyltransferase [[Clostridium] symbiosum]NSF83702.1 methionyl-tRNA formyltransferase [[Clostridium] symbiosum]NSJ00357.1 methionyl-tRNA formyltransferase [[Clostridium] symbiosum]